MARGKKHTAEQAVNLLRQIEAGEREAEAFALGVGSRGAGSRVLSESPLFCVDIYLYWILFINPKSMRYTNCWHCWHGCGAKFDGNKVQGVRLPESSVRRG